MCFSIEKQEREAETDKRRTFEIERYELGKIRNQFKCSIYILVCGDTKISVQFLSSGNRAVRIDQVNVLWAQTKGLAKRMLSKPVL